MPKPRGFSVEFPGLPVSTEGWALPRRLENEGKSMSFTSCANSRVGNRHLQFLATPPHANHGMCLLSEATLPVGLVLGVETWSWCFREISNCPFWVDLNSQITKDLFILFNSSAQQKTSGLVLVFSHCFTLDKSPNHSGCLPVLLLVSERGEVVSLWGPHNHWQSTSHGAQGSHFLSLAFPLSEKIGYFYRQKN